MRSAFVSVSAETPQRTSKLLKQQNAFTAGPFSYDMPRCCCCEQPDSECRLTRILCDLGSAANLVQKHGSDMR